METVKTKGYTTLYEIAKELNRAPKPTIHRKIKLLEKSGKIKSFISKIGSHYFKFYYTP